MTRCFEVGVDPAAQRQAIDAARVVGEEVAQVPVANGGVVPVERLPLGLVVTVSVISRDGSRCEGRRLE